MKILLLNENSVVSRLISLSAKKMSYDFEELNAYSDDIGYCDVIVVDSDTPAPLKILKEKCDKLIFLAPRNQTIDIEAQILYKPFLPTDFLNLLDPSTNNPPNPYSDMQLDLDNLNLEDLPEENPISEIAEDSLSLDENLESLSLDEEEQEKDQMKENVTSNSSEEVKEIDENDSINETSSEAIETMQEISLEDENNKEENLEEQKVEDLDNIDEILQDDLATQEISDETSEEFMNDEDLNLQEGLEDQVEISEENNENLNSDEALPIVEEQEKEVSFDDIPEDAEFLGQAEENIEEMAEDFIPVVEDEENLDELDNLAELGNLSTQDQIKEELAQLDELEHDIEEDDSVKILEDFKGEPILDDESLGTSDDEVVVPNVNEQSSENDFDDLKENDILKALGEEALVEEVKEEESVYESEEKQIPKGNNTGDEIVNELSQSIAGAITSSIKDDTLKAALKGMNMNININISFNEDKN